MITGFLQGRRSSNPYRIRLNAKSGNLYWNGRAFGPIEYAAEYRRIGLAKGVSSTVECKRQRLSFPGVSLTFEVVND